MGVERPACPPRTETKRIVALGSINVDVAVRVERTPQAGDTTHGSDFVFAGGGKAANIAYLARRLGAEAALIGLVGDDLLAAVALAPLREAGVDLSGTCRVPDCATGVALIIVTAQGDKTMTVAPNANGRWTQADEARVAQAVAAAGAGVVLVTDMEAPRGVVFAAVHAARAASGVVVLDPSPADRIPHDLLPLVDYMMPDAGEAATLTGMPVRTEEDAGKAGHALVARGVRAALMKLPGGGCRVVEHERAITLRAPAVAAVDKTGAGDAFAAALAVGLVERVPAEQALRQAVAASTIAVTRFGAQASYPTRAELDAMAARVSVHAAN